MTSNALLTALLPLVTDLARDLPERERYRRLLQSLRLVLPCDAAALLRLDGSHLQPMAVDGLSIDTLGRRFKVADHPRLQILLDSPAPTRFPSDSPLPDPYDGLIEGLGDELHVHDCMGCPLYIDDRPWGLLTLDALTADSFPAHASATLQAFAALAAATVRVAEHIERLATRAEHERQRADSYVAQALSAPMMGQSLAMEHLRQEIETVASTHLTVLVTGETGVGKELVAQALHRGSTRAGRPLVSLNCAALPDTLVESELFGHVRGAFTGATNDRRGKFELADGGTLLLDEVGELPLPVQAKLLRVLQSGQLQRVGSDREHRVDVRVIAATNRDLAERTRAGLFRDDLYHRLSVYPIRVPPLRERGRDVLLLAGYFLEQNRGRLGLAGLRLSSDAQTALLDYPWPGNVRELEHSISRAVLRARPRDAKPASVVTLTGQTLGLAASESMPQANPARACELPIHGPGLREAVDDFQRGLIQRTLEQHHMQWASTARALGIDRANLNRLAQRLKIKPAQGN
ncbi:MULTISPECIES: nitric oxide reductase transcriptional regulator NorR [unclassified Pseudomonas]|uniref:nitric oxide reductase transcriptional regulator NorR n=1 Tax=unclassified Pseudomonas TaxID=196821 RepID=UPI000BD1CE98|nr:MULTISPECIES: nitric oxide reductase transcriptional regulator NorR [unclassified Pseudomonas]PVZ11214.1 anaerobic nitric oxide reductase transcription regulator [Pseudomonas sp. URIL14HWK12:I12]PVZ22212.1 anaerobic nitric oxide reductase transcription regulator [Pseudomonas sp. URIL14HWK12:I10]PVZ31664.1 anaerobic nitric oxide reductase transcription regulator [Pseudomonas sp. URIL14HWK12:I11]SNZ16739.1 anaerobic nitric oxide reductase transcription regulator [Pseudomonas sp. URIL14HWK12:I9